MSYGVIYKIVNTVDRKLYIGQTIQDPNERFKQHIRESKHPERSFHFQRAIAKYGAENFILEVLCECHTQEELDEQEKYFANLLNAWSPNGYNVRAGRGRGSVNEEERKRMSISRKGLLVGERNPMFGRVGEKSPSFGRTGEKSPNFGKQMSEESKKKKSLALKGRFIGEESSMFGKTHSEESKHKMSKRQLGENNSFFGKRHSAEMIAKKAKTYYFVSSENVQVIVKNLREFCREHPELHRSALLRVVKGTQKAHKGWTRNNEYYEMKEDKL